MTKSEAVKIVSLLRAHYPAWKASAETISTWAECLEDLEFALVNAAVKRLILSRAREWPPPVAMIREEAAKLVDPAISVSPEEAWAEVLSQVRQVGWCGTPCWSHDSLGQAVAAMGWREICMSEEGDVGTRAHFFRVYSAHQGRKKENAILPPALRLELPSREESKRILTEVHRLRLLKNEDPGSGGNGLANVKGILAQLVGTM